jgi:hypothetical protein
MGAEEKEMPAAEPVDGMGAGEEEMPEDGDDFNWTDDSLSASVGGNEYDFKVGMVGAKKCQQTNDRRNARRRTSI